jgi:hypothetical protein
MASKEGVSTVHSRAEDGAFDEVRVDVDATIVKKQPKTVMTLQHISHGHAEAGFVLDTFGLSDLPPFVP